MIRIALAQLDTTVGDVGGNVELILDAYVQAEQAGAQVVAVPELAVTGYPPEDLVLKRSFLDANLRALDAIAAATRDVLSVVGFVDVGPNAIYNAAAICQQGEVLAVYRKQLLPNYGVFDEQRYFRPGRGHTLLQTKHGVLGVCVCEDAWYEPGPLVSQGDAGAQIVVNINASPFHKNKMEERCAMLGERARRAKAAIAYVNSVGGQDELVFDGGSVIIDPQGEVVARLPQFVEAFSVFDVPLGEAGAKRDDSIRVLDVSLPEGKGTSAHEITPLLDDAPEVYDALVIALRDYVKKNGFQKIVLGLSGGIDSSLAATIAVDAIGSENVLGVAMPSEFSTSHSVDDAQELAENLGMEMVQIPIAPAYHSYLDALRTTFGETDMGLAEENLQARIRGNLVMAISNRYGHLVIATGNKSEMACGYATLYGDMAGGYAILKDVFKTEVYELSAYRNSLGKAIPGNVLTKPPSAELRPGQKDSDSLPPYDVLDPILEGYIERDEGVADLVAAGHDAATVTQVIALVDRAEYKRRQAPPGPKVTTKAFGRDRRLPISSRWREGEVGALPAKVVGERGPR